MCHWLLQQAMPIVNFCWRVWNDKDYESKILSWRVIPLKPPLLVTSANWRVELTRCFVPEPGKYCPEKSSIDRMAVGRPKGSEKWTGCLLLWSDWYSHLRNGTGKITGTSLPNLICAHDLIINGIKSRKIRWVEPVAQMWKWKMHTKF
jgi:hypothetical protein